MTERLLEHFSEIASDWFWEMDSELRFSYFSKRLEEATGVDRTAAIGKTRREIAANSGDPAFWAQHLADLDARRPFRDLIYPYPTRSGRVRWFKISGQPVFDGDGTFLGYRGVGTDITVERESVAQLEETLSAYAQINAEFDWQNKLLIEQEQKLIEQSGLLAATLDHMDQGLLMFGPDSRVLVYNRRALELLELPAELLARVPTFEEIIRFQHGTDEFRADEAFQRFIAEEGPDAAHYKNYERVRPNGTVLEVRTVRLPGGGAVRTYSDITERRRQEKAIAEREQALGEQNQRLDAALTNMAHGLCMFDAERRLILCNAAYQAMYDLPEALTRRGTAFDEIAAYREARGNAVADRAGRDERVRLLTSGVAANARAELVDGRIIQIISNVLPSGGFVSAHQDLTEHIRAEAKIAHMARHDALTNLPNRVLLRERMETALATLVGGGTVAVLFLDLDGFKAVNDTLGHAVGDVLLQAVTQRLRQCVNEAAVVARLGGDEFAILISDAPERIELAALARRVIASIALPYDIDGHHIVIGASIGVSVAPRDGSDPDTLLRNADVALYRAKSDGRGTFRLFEPEMDERLQERRRLELALRRALAASEFELFYQPVVDAVSGGIRGFEALLRWQDPERGMIGPDRFIPLAEEIGLIIPIGEWVLRRACATAASWPSGIKVAVNLSPAQFRSPALVPAVVSALGSSGLSPDRLELEITETVLLQENEATLAKLHQLRALGIRIALDDFGTGYCSLSYLRAFPFDKIKIDRSFIRDLSEKADCLAIVKAVASLGASLGMTTTAEGIETEEQLRQVRENGCTEAQGYLFSPPVPATRLPELLVEPRSVAA